MKSYSIGKTNLFVNLAGAAMLCLLLLLVYLLYHASEGSRKHASQAAQRQAIVAEMEFTNEALVHNARQFCHTADTLYENRYRQLYDVFTGKKSRPDGTFVPLADMAKSAGFTPEALQLLREAEFQSRDLRNLEQSAISTVKRDASFTLATELLSSAQFNLKHGLVRQRIDQLRQILDESDHLAWQELARSSTRFWWAVLVLVSLSWVAILVAQRLVSQRIVRPMTQIRDSLEAMALGKFDHLFADPADDEIGRLASALNTIGRQVSQKAEALELLAQGQLQIPITPISKHDELGRFIVELKESLRAAREQEQKRIQEDIARNWTTEGLAKFGEILRKDNDNIRRLADNINVNMVKYLQANQGGLFIINNDAELEEPTLELVSAFAYDRRRSEKRVLRIDEGLIGRCLRENQTIHMTEIPQGYLSITSGLGESSPTNLLIVPLAVNKEAFGVIEIASFNPFLPYQVAFVEKIGESIASTLATVRINAQTAQLLAQAQDNAEEMAAQEEEMRQNLEELQATQEALDKKDRQQQKIIQRLNKQNEAKLKEILNAQIEMEEKEYEMQGVLKAMQSSALVLEFDLQGKILDINAYFLDFLRLERNEVIGMTHKQLYEKVGANTQNANYDRFWQNLMAGISRKEMTAFQIDGKECWLSETYSPILNKDSEPYKIINIATDITEIKRQETEMHELLSDSRFKTKQMQVQEGRLKEQIAEIEKTRKALASKDIEQKEIIKGLEEQYQEKLAEIEQLKTAETEKIKKIQQQQLAIITKYKEKSTEKLEKLNARILELEEELRRLKPQG